MKRITCSAAVLALAVSSTMAYESVRELTQDFQRKQNEALEAYIAGKPDAADASEARQRLIMGYRMAGDDARALPLLQKQYAALAAKPAESNLREVMSTASALIEIFAETAQKDAGRAFIQQVGKDFAAHPDAERIKGALDRMAGQLNKPAVGEAVDLKFKSTDGREIDLAAMKGKVVLIDFWATWCGPCRAEMPNVKKVYAEYKDKGFEILAISLDREREALDAYVKEQELAWPQYFDGKAWETELASRFGVTGIPATFLVGKDGKLAASNVRGDELGREVGRLLAAEGK